jgi:hypothetical protein
MRRNALAALIAALLWINGCGGAGIPAGPAAQPQEGRASGTRQTGMSAQQKSGLSRAPRAVASTTRAVNNPAELADDSEPVLFQRLDETFKRKGEVKDGVYRLVTPRTDLFVTMDGRDVPTGAFLESDFRFWRCPCGKLIVNGQFVLADYESNDVVDELQKGQLKVVSIAPLLLHEQPRLLLIRFQGEGDATGLASALRSALSYTAEERSKPIPANLAPRAD